MAQFSMEIMRLTGSVLRGNQHFFGTFHRGSRICSLFRYFWRRGNSPRLYRRGLLLLIFSVGFVTLNSIVKRPGDFYAFISYGIGKSMGLRAGLLAAVCYFLLVAGVISFFGVSFANLMTQTTGSTMPWYFYSFFAWAAIGVLGYLHIELSAKGLSFVMMLEIAVVLVFAVSVLIGSDGILPASAPLLPSNLLSNNPVFAFLFAIMMFLGFEATALYRDELRDPDVTIPRATYGSVIFMGALYTFATYALIIAYGANAAQVATNDPVGGVLLACTGVAQLRYDRKWWLDDRPKSGAWTHERFLPPGEMSKAAP